MLMESGRNYKLPTMEVERILYILKQCYNKEEENMTGGTVKTLDEIKSILALHKEELRQRYKVKELGIFGSYVRGDQRKRSDIDILVEFSQPIGLKFFTLENYLSKILGLKVDLVTKGALKPIIREDILKEVIKI